MAIDAPIRHRPETLREQNQRMELTVLSSEARDHVNRCLPSAKRLLDSAMRDGRFHDFQDAALLNHSLERLQRRHAK